MMKKEEIISFLADNKSKLQIEFNVSKIGLFGSYSTGRQNENSDIDIIIGGNNVKDTELKLFLEDKFCKKVDLVKEENLYNFMKYLINQEAIYV
jgi:hypothetical protein